MQGQSLDHLNTILGKQLEEMDYQTSPLLEKLVSWEQLRTCPLMENIYLRWTELNLMALKVEEPWNFDYSCRYCRMDRFLPAFLDMRKLDS